MNANATQSVTVKEVINPQDLLEYTEKRINRRSARAQAKRLNRNLWRARKRYAGGTTAEMDSLREIKTATRLACRQTMLSAQGRKIDLVGLLSQRRKDGMPLWALVNPREALGRHDHYSWVNSNGAYTRAIEGNGRHGARPAGFCVAQNDCTENTCHTHVVPCDLGLAIKEPLQPSGMPALPTKVRRIVSDKKVLKRSKWIGVLYQPETWQQVNPDPALVVEWNDLPGQYFALAVWGGDYHRIMEFVD